MSLPYRIYILFFFTYIFINIYIEYNLVLEHAVIETEPTVQYNTKIRDEG